MKPIVALSLGLSALLAGLWLLSDTQTASETREIDTPVVIAEPKQQPKPEIKAAEPAQIHVSEKVPEPITESFKLLASAYASELSFPSYSRPLTADDSALLSPNQYIVQNVPLEGGASAAIVLDKYRFSYPEPVGVTLQVDGITVTDVIVQLNVEQDQLQLALEPMQADSGNWTATIAAEPEWNAALEVVVSFDANGKTQSLKAGIVYSHPVATLTGVGESSGAGSDMKIPLLIDVEQAGYYRLRANLYTAERQPLAILTATDKLAAGSEKLLLKVHKSVLKGYAGPFILGSFVLERRPAIPGEPTLYGDSEKSEYPLEQFALSQLSDEPWQPDEDEQQRLKFLQQMAEQ
jgi:hypothetical protein